MKAVPANRYVFFLLIAGLGCALDLATKSWVFGWLGMPGGKSYWLIDQIFGFTTSLNEGALFGIGQGQVLLFASLSIVAAIGIVYWLFIVGAASDWMLTIALGGVMAGIFGNLYDRLGMPKLIWNFPNPPLHEVGQPVYAVRDWLHFKIDAIGFDWPIFNLADSLLVCGAALLVWHSLRTDQAKHSATSPSASASTP